MNAVLPTPPVPPAAGLGSAPPPAAQPRPAAPTATARPVPPVGAAERTGRLDEQVAAAAAAAFRGRELAVETRHDEATGRFVVRVRDRVSGEVVAQLPPEDLLRFWAASRGEASLVDRHA